MDKENDGSYQNKRRKLDDSDTEQQFNNYDEDSDYWPDSDSENSMLKITNFHSYLLIISVLI